MKKIILLLTVFVTTFAFAQKKDFNLKKGFIAKGYDVVSYFDNEAEEGKKEFLATHNNVNYQFASKQHLEIFKKNPEKYTPQYGGWCAYALGANNAKFDIDPETFEIRDGKLYLFYNSWGINTFEKWTKENPEELIIKADNYWKSLE